MKRKANERLKGNGSGSLVRVVLNWGRGGRGGDGKEGGLVMMGLDKRCNASASVMWRVQGRYLAALETHPSVRGVVHQLAIPEQVWGEMKKSGRNKLKQGEGGWKRMKLKIKKELNEKD